MQKREEKQKQNEKTQELQQTLLCKSQQESK